MLIIFPEKYLSSSLSGLKIFAVNVLPALLPFFFFSKILSALGAGNILGSLLAKPCNKLYNTSGIGGYVFIMSTLSGYPIGAKLVADFVKNKQLSIEDAKSIIAYTSTSGPMFIMGSVGSVMLQNKYAGFILLICHYFSALLNGLIYRKKSHSKTEHTQIQPLITDNILSESIYSSVISVLIAGAYVTIFYMCATMIEDIGIMSIISSLLTKIINNETIASGLVFGSIEMTGGCLMLSKSTSILTLPSICTLISFGGLSVTLQSMTFLESCGISPFRYLLTKFTQAIIAFCMTLIVVMIINPL